MSPLACGRLVIVVITVVVITVDQHLPVLAVSQDLSQKGKIFRLMYFCVSFAQARFLPANFFFLLSPPFLSPTTQQHPSSMTLRLPTPPDFDSDEEEGEEDVMPKRKVLAHLNVIEGAPPNEFDVFEGCCCCCCC